MNMKEMHKVNRNNKCHNDDIFTLLQSIDSGMVKTYGFFIAALK